jgi:hypothetical protein
MFSRNEKGNSENGTKTKLIQSKRTQVSFCRKLHREINDILFCIWRPLYRNGIEP